MYGCVPPSAGVCMATAGCDGDDLLMCDPQIQEQWNEDCAQVVPEGTCVVINNFYGCGWGSECSPGAYLEVCDGTTLRSCIYGAETDIDCASLGGTSCGVNTMSASDRRMCLP
jgi:hypothetical protein